jgi:hypothetical protein
MSVADMFTSVIFSVLALPGIPPEIGQAVGMVFEWMGAAMGIFDFFCPLSSIAPAVAFFLIVYAVQKLYHVIVWVIKKIPFAGVE